MLSQTGLSVRAVSRGYTSTCSPNVGVVQTCKDRFQTGLGVGEMHARIMWHMYFEVALHNTDTCMYVSSVTIMSSAGVQVGDIALSYAYRYFNK